MNYFDTMKVGNTVTGLPQDLQFTGGYIEIQFLVANIVFQIAIA
jgi:hypothetical protein